MLYITGRKKNLIILSNGKNVYPEEIENVLSATPGVLESCQDVRETEEELAASAIDLDGAHRTLAGGFGQFHTGKLEIGLGAGTADVQVGGHAVIAGGAVITGEDGADDLTTVLHARMRHPSGRRSNLGITCQAV